ncbi:MAG: GTP-binding protein, partial [Planctomycetota bacterium]
QAPDLVDTEVLRDACENVDEVAGGCFCCRFPDLITAMDRLVRESAAEVLLGEPVGSCTDLSATVMQPLKKYHGNQYEIAPFSVLIDVKQVGALARLQQAAESTARFPDNVLYIYEKQLEEADVIVLNKADLLNEDELAELRSALARRYPETPLLMLSALTGDGVDAWLEFVSQQQPAGKRIVEVDYDTYAAGEAALGWMNAAATLEAERPVDWAALAEALLETMRTSIEEAGGEIGHVKLFLTAKGHGHLVGNITSNAIPAVLRGMLAPEARRASLLLNARVRMDATKLQSLSEAALAESGPRYGAKPTVTNIRSFYPGRPEPTHRFAEVVE